MMELGKKIKLLRKERSFTLAEVSQRTGIAQSTLSRIEKGLRTGNVKTHLKICAALGIRISELYVGLEKPEEEITSVETATKNVEGFVYNDKAYSLLLVRNIFKKRMKPELLILAPAKTAKEPGDPPGTEKFLFLHEGVLEVVVDNVQYHLKKGSSLYFNSSLAHSFKNIGKTTAKCLCISSR